MSFSGLLCFPGVFAVKNPIISAVFLIVSLVICLTSLVSLSFEDDIAKSYASGSSYSEDYQAFLSSIGFVPKQVVILAESQPPFDKQSFETLHNLAFEIELTDGVSSVFSLASVRFPVKHEQLSRETLIVPGLNIQNINKRIKIAENIGMRLPISSDRKSAIFLVSFEVNVEEDSFLSTTEQLKSAIEEHGGTRLRYSVTGDALVGPELVTALQRDLVINNVAGCFIAMLLAFLMFRKLRLIIIALVPSLLAAIVSLSIFPILNFPITVLNTVMPILVLVLALSDSIHLTLYFRDHHSDLPLTERINRTITMVGPACALTAITTSIAFGAIAISDNAQLKDLAIVGSLSVLFAYIIVIISFAVLARFFGKKVQPTNKEAWLHIPRSWTEIILRHSRRIYVFCALLAVFSLLGMSTLKPWFNLDENLPTTSTMRATNQVVTDNFGGFYRIWSELEFESDQNLIETANWSKLMNITSAIQSAAPGYPVVSLATYAQWLGVPDKMPSESEMEQLPKELRKQLVSEDHRLARVMVVMPEPMHNPQTLRKQNDIEMAALSAGASRNVGLPIVMRYESTSVVEHLWIGLAFACVISTMLVAAFYQWPFLAIYLIIPNVLPLAVAAGSLALIREGELTPTAMLALTIAFGIAVDDSIHLVNRFLLETKGGLDIDEALVISMQETGRAMIVTTILICSGMFVTMLSSFEMIRLFGGMLILTFVTALFADLLLLPCLLKDKMRLE